MSSINDVLKEKFNVSGSNIAETLSKITPGGGSLLIVAGAYDAELDAAVLNKTAKEILQAAPNVVLTVAKNNGQRTVFEPLCMVEGSLTKYCFAFNNPYAPFDTKEIYWATSLDEFPTSIEPDDKGGDDTPSD